MIRNGKEDIGVAFAVNRNEKHIVTITDLTSAGQGVGKIDHYPLFIPNTIPGEIVEVRVTKTLKRYGFGEVTEWIEQSPDRVVPSCAVYDECGGCQLQHLSYEAQLQQKWQTVRDAMDRIGHLKDVPVHPVKGMETPWRYRNKSQVPIGLQQGKAVWGFYRSRTHDIVDTEQCLIQSEEADQLLNGLRRHLFALGLTPYDEERHKGMLRHVIVRTAEATGETMVVFVTRQKQLKHREEIVKAVRKILPNVTSIVQNVNSEKTNTILGRTTYPMYGPTTIVDEINGIRFEISAQSFFQVNSKQTDVLYRQTLEYAELTGTERVVDAYCGIGTISLFLAKDAAHVHGVEIVEQAIEDAKRNAALNGFDNVTFEVGASEDVVTRWYEEGQSFDVLVVDPPRKGCDETLIDTILERHPRRVVYVSCNPATLARDLKMLSDGGYTVEEVQPVDMFGHSTHIENVAKLTWGR